MDGLALRQVPWRRDHNVLAEFLAMRPGMLSSNALPISSSRLTTFGARFPPVLHGLGEHLELAVAVVLLIQRLKPFVHHGRHRLKMSIPSSRPQLRFQNQPSVRVTQERAGNMSLSSGTLLVRHICFKTRLHIRNRRESGPEDIDWR